MPHEFLRACILLILTRSPNYGYKIVSALAEFGFNVNQPRAYRVLRQMDERGLVQSEWSDSDAGPRRRVYTLTDAGRTHLEMLKQPIRRLREPLDRFLKEAS